MNQQNTADELEQMIDQAWTDLVDKDDRTSPEEHQDMALITAEELREFMGRVAALRAAGSAEPVAWITKAALENWQKGHDPEKHVLLRSGHHNNLRVPLYLAAPAESVREALRLLRAEDDRQTKLHEILETIREQIRLGVPPEHRPEGLFKNIQDAVYAMRGRTALMNDAAILAALSPNPLPQTVEKAAEPSPIMQAASRPAETIAGWSDAKRDYAARAMGDGLPPFQMRVKAWMMDCFSMETCRDRQERNHRFLEEALELVQACGCTASEAHQLVDYVYGRDQGEINQEVGGVMVTLAALCLASDIDMHEGGEDELARILKPETMAKIQAKQAAKPKHSPLPQAAAEPTREEIAVEVRRVAGSDLSHAQRSNLTNAIFALTKPRGRTREA